MRHGKRLGFFIRDQLLCRFPAFSLRLLAWGAHARHLFSTPQRRELEQNLSLAFPIRSDREIANLARRTLVTNLVDGAAQLRLELLSRTQLFEEALNLQIVGEENLELAYAEGQPVILITPHYGNYMQAALRVALEKRHKTVYFFYNPNERNPYADTSDALLDRVNEHCVKIHNDRKGVISAMRALKKGGILCIMPDQITPEGEVVYVPFFGRFFGVMQGVAFLALKTRAQIMPIFCYMRNGGVPVLEFCPPVAVNAGLGEEAHVYSLTAALFNVIEQQFLKAPTHWKYWNQFAQRSLSSPMPPKSHADMAAQLDAVQKRLSADPAAREVVAHWQQLLRNPVGNDGF